MTHMGNLDDLRLTEGHVRGGIRVCGHMYRRVRRRVCGHAVGVSTLWEDSSRRESAAGHS